jgi:hypothetical protein
VILFHNANAPSENAGLLCYAMFYVRTDTALHLMIDYKVAILIVFRALFWFYHNIII